MEAQKGTEENPWTRDDIQDGSMMRAAQAAKAAKAKQDEQFEAGLSEEGSMSRILEHGTTEEKAKAFEYMAANQSNKKDEEITELDFSKAMGSPDAKVRENAIKLKMKQEL